MGVGHSTTTFSYNIENKILIQSDLCFNLNIVLTIKFSFSTFFFFIGSATSIFLIIFCVGIITKFVIAFLKIKKINNAFAGRKLCGNYYAYCFAEFFFYLLFILNIFLNEIHLKNIHNIQYHHEIKTEIILNNIWLFLSLAFVK